MMGNRKLSKINEMVFERTVEEITGSTQKLLENIPTKVAA